ncbi:MULTISPECIES: sigma-70 family RNA polymerase sigma factor [unclassified Mycolicibacterium]|uniref:sigma-70 family RNA polymerase sigma factor n=1 Tax=unclassified Mycolicibacterium TaxID=2636767 RepID=UPI0013073E4C|nr:MULTISPECIES: sigma-70 family RNA polymerase sigma factor [unclassified Mycolicibacterium]MUL85102.1 sigma-70 family RNA polymerase sigma factor [Mycolicibacterium sp. CBMA 329]MUL91069.1 sigma-70 family RNA polymerase sigma factor [Mycolicibacterium sp. CBMA 331]MUL98260.1 sigma-70 family RNA polymerase sigma factor [Mycolicibacterium sp. CBMA 334]MUM26138.1 sigma-70 family RNA polymerase sigma factor [Mycolicibacterium sp. CBMA 295]MUM40828.1 sigma-70 family RNA polymerase sigma factor [M
MLTAERPTGQMLELYGNHVEPLRRYAFRLTSNHTRAEDVVQETLLRAWRHLLQHDGDQPVRSWLFTVARNIVIDSSRSARVRYEVFSPDTPEVPDRMGADEVNTALDRMLVASAMAGLPDTHRAVLSRAYYLGWTTGKIADDLGIPEGTVKSRLHYALRRLRLILAEMGCDARSET